MLLPLLLLLLLLLFLLFITDYIVKKDGIKWCNKVKQLNKNLHHSDQCNEGKAQNPINSMDTSKKQRIKISMKVIRNVTRTYQYEKTTS